MLELPVSSSPQRQGYHSPEQKPDGTGDLVAERLRSTSLQLHQIKHSYNASSGPF